MVEGMPGRRTEELATDVFADFDQDDRAAFEQLTSPVAWLSLAPKGCNGEC
jgi:hypothetical protein